MKSFIIIIQVFGGLTLIPWFIAAGVSFLSFDTPESVQKIGPWVFVLIVFSYPFLLSGSFSQAWDFYGVGKIIEAIVFSILPFIIFVIAYFIITRFTNFYSQLNRRK